MRPARFTPNSAQQLTRYFAHSVGSPGRIPNQFDLDCRCLRKIRLKHLADLFDHHFGQRARWRTQRQRDLYSLRTILGTVHEPEIDDVNADFRIDHALQGCQYIRIIHVASVRGLIAFITAEFATSA